MEFFHSAELWAEFPSLVAAVLLVEAVTATPDVAGQSAPLFERARKRLANSSEADFPEVQAWRRAFSHMGLKPTQYRSAAESLLRRFRKEATLPTLHPLVDLCNAASLAYALPVAVFDLDQIDTFLEVRHATGAEQYQAFSGEVERPDPGEVIFADAAQQVHARRWTFRQSRRSTVSAATTRALVVSEGLHAEASSAVPALMSTLALALANAGFAPSTPAILTARAARFALA